MLFFLFLITIEKNLKERCPQSFPCYVSGVSLRCLLTLLFLTLQDFFFLFKSRSWVCRILAAWAMQWILQPLTLVVWLVIWKHVSKITLCHCKVFLTHGFEMLCKIFVLHVYCILHWDKDKGKSLPVVFWFSLGCIKTVHITPVFLYFIYELQYQGWILMDKRNCGLMKDSSIVVKLILPLFIVLLTQYMHSS